MTDKQYRAFLDLLMCSDPWPVSEHNIPDSTQNVLMALADDEARKRGYNTWIEAYHEFEPGEDWKERVRRRVRGEVKEGSGNED